MYYLIYQITNKINGKIYIGKHITDDKNDGYMGSGKYLKASQHYHGIENFEKTILFECSSEDEMNAKEREIVNEDFIKRDDTYNIALGGDGGWYHLHSCGARKGGIAAQRIAKEKGINLFSRWFHSLSEQERVEYVRTHNTLKSFRYDWLGRKHSEETKKKISLSSIGKHNGEKNPAFGKKWIKNPQTHESMRIDKNDDVPKGWELGRFCK